LETFPTAHLNLQDVHVVVVFPPSSFDLKTAAERQRVHTALQNCTARARLAGDVVVVWRDRYGTTKFIAPPQQHPFFQIVKYEQLYAQVNGTIDC
jgi:hypothetical protein